MTSKAVSRGALAPTGNVTREVLKRTGQPETAFRFGQDGPVKVFYWVDKNFGYAISGGADHQELMCVSLEDHRQLAPG